MTIVIDTSLIIDFLRGDARALACLADGRRRGDGRLIASVLTRTEVRAGMRSHEESSTEQLFAQFVWIPVTEDIADVAGRFCAGLLAVTCIHRCDRLRYCSNLSHDLRIVVDQKY